MPANVALTPDLIDDLVKTTLEKPIKKSWVDISLGFQEYEFARRFMKQVDEVDSYKLTWLVQFQNTGSARVSGLFDVDNVDVKNLMTKAEINWAKVNASFRYDIDEPEFNGGPEQIVDYIAVRRHSLYNDYFELMEELMWDTSDAEGGPSAATTPLSPYGIPYWLQRETGSTASAFGFNGGNPAAGNAGNLDTATYAKWKNGTFNYAALSEDDGLDKWSTACDKTHFKAPHPFNETAGGEPDYGFYTTHTNLQRLRRMAKASNDDIGNDVGAYRGVILFKSIPINWVPAFTEDSAADSYVTDNPIFGINWKTLDWTYRASRNQRITGPIMVGGSHTVRDVHLDTWGNFKCLNRRANFVGKEV